MFNVVIRELWPPNLPPDYVTRISNATLAFQEAFRSNWFRTVVCGFGGLATGFYANFGLNNIGIYNKLLGADELQGNIQHGTADLFLRIIPGSSPDNRTIGYVTHYSKVINTYGYFINHLSHAELSAHFAHEWTHVLGFRHPVNDGTNEDDLDRTVPYAIEHMVAFYLKERAAGNHL